MTTHTNPSTAAALALALGPDDEHDTANLAAAGDSPALLAQALDTARRYDRAAAVTPALLDWWARWGPDLRSYAAESRYNGRNVHVACVGRGTLGGLFDLLDSFASLDAPDWRVVCGDGESRHGDPFPSRDEAIRWAHGHDCDSAAHDLVTWVAGLGHVTEAI